MKLNNDKLYLWFPKYHIEVIDFNTGNILISNNNSLIINKNLSLTYDLIENLYSNGCLLKSIDCVNLINYNCNQLISTGFNKIFFLYDNFTYQIIDDDIIFYSIIDKFIIITKIKCPNKGKI